MKQILVLIENELEQSITGDILRSGLGAEAEITLTAGAEQAIQQLQSGTICSSRTGPRGCWPRCAPWCVRSAAADAPPTSRRFT